MSPGRDPSSGSRDAGPQEGDRRRERWDLEAEAPAKLNLALHVVRRRPDGYHDLRTVFQAIDLADRLYLRERRGPGISLRVEGPEAPSAGPPGENLVLRAAQRLARRRAPDRGAEVLLVKNVPAGGGLGGGSSDAAATLLALERLWGLAPDREETAQTALSLGSDVPFFLVGGTALGEGRGERLSPLPPPPDFGWLLAIPPFGVSTTEAFARVSGNLTFSEGSINLLLDALQRGDRKQFADNLVNDLYVGVVRIQPRLATIRHELLARGALAVGLSGSGSTQFALVEALGTAGERLSAGGACTECRLIACAPVGHGARVSAG
jgi:4-diphosphocytidyl-2-C-methyl-D-erythritol kinase